MEDVKVRCRDGERIKKKKKSGYRRRCRHDLNVRVECSVISEEGFGCQGGV